MTSLAQKISSALADLFGGGSGDAFRSTLDVPKVEDVGLIYLGTATPSGGFIDLTPLMDAQYDDYRIVFEGLATPGAGAFYIQFATAAGWQGAGYYYGHIYCSSAASGTVSSNAVTAASAIPIAINNTAMPSNYGASGVTDVIATKNRSNSGTCKATSSFACHTPGYFLSGNCFGQLSTPANDVTGMRLTGVNNTITTGKAKLYGYRKTA